MLRLLRPAAHVCLFLLMVLSLAPADYLVRTGADSRFEHFVAYAGSTLVTVAAYRARVRPLTVALLLIAYAGLLETGQIWIPGRYASFFDWGASSTGVVFGAALAAPLVLRSFNRPGRTKPDPDRVGAIER
jgi:VanZ family protein